MKVHLTIVANRTGVGSKFYALEIIEIETSKDHVSAWIWERLLCCTAGGGSIGGAFLRTVSSGLRTVSSGDAVGCTQTIPNFCITGRPAISVLNLIACLKNPCRWRHVRESVLSELYRRSFLEIGVITVRLNFRNAGTLHYRSIRLLKITYSASTIVPFLNTFGGGENSSFA